jgi:hypothetical protein
MKSAKDEDVYVSMDYFDSIESKKEFLEVTASIINMQMIGEKIKSYTKKELADRSTLRRQVKSMISEISRAIEVMPKVDASKFEEHHTVKKPKEEEVYLMPPKEEEKMEVKSPKQKALKSTKPAERKSLNDELADIKKKIESIK